MKSKIIAAAVVAATTFASFGASAQVFNSWLFDQASTSTTQTRAEVKNEAKQGHRDQATVSGIGALAQPEATRTTEKTAPEARSAGLVKTSSN